MCLFTLLPLLRDLFCWFGEAVLVFGCLGLLLIVCLCLCDLLCLLIVILHLFVIWIFAVVCFGCDLIGVFVFVTWYLWVLLFGFC